ncbi:MAG: hypothetical protein ACFB0C_24245 [Leptolyngbyaceae cyanobacterium]
MPPAPEPPSDPVEDIDMDGTITIPRCDGGSTSYPYDSLDGFGSAIGYALAAMATDNCQLLNGEVVLPECTEPDEEEINIFFEVVVGLISGQIVDVLIAVLGRSGLQGIAATILLQIVGEVLAIALNDFFRSFFPADSGEPEQLQWEGRGLHGLSAQLEAVSKQVERLGEILCQEELPEDPGEQQDPSCNAVILLPAEPLNELQVPTQLVIKFGQNYPSSSGSRWSIHLPHPIGGLDWCEHFEGLFRTVVDADASVRWCARQYWANSRLWTGGYFADENEAIGFLDVVIGLSQATPGKRTITQRIKPDGLGAGLAVRNVRAVRAIVSDIDNSSGRPVIGSVKCYAPPRDGCD